MIELHTKYHPGRRTFIYFLFKYGWGLILLGAAFGYLSYLIAFGSLQPPVAQLLAAHPQWYMDTTMFAQWLLIASLGFLLLAFLRVSVQYRWYTFYIDDHAFHLSRGLIRVQEITIPYKQISNVHIEQPYIWRLFGLAKLDITISSTRDPLRIKKRRDFLIPCIDKSLAKAMSHFLVKEASGEEEEEDDEYDEEDDGEDVIIGKEP
jgi:uncharacterized membrane protein YdbT with pleckstrin-like domain